jgi:hypothetical protein
MSDPRKEWLILTKKLPRKRGKKSVKIELYPAELWSERIRPESKSRANVRLFDPEPRKAYKTSDLAGFFRIKIDGRKWLRLEGYDYSFVTELEAFRIFRKLSWDSSFKIKYWSEKNV